MIVTNLLDLRLDHLGARLLDANSELSWSHILDYVLLAVAAMIAGTGTRRAPARRRLWLAVTAIFLALFADEISPLHAAIGGRIAKRAHALVERRLAVTAHPER